MDNHHSHHALSPLPIWEGRGDKIKPENVSGSLPKLNSIVVDKSLNRIGTIVNVFGPVNHPYFLVKGFKRTPDSEIRALVNERVYIR